MVKPFTRIAVVVFSLVAFMHLLRLFFHWQVIVNNMVVPQWVSVPGLVIAGALAFMLTREAKK
jgi:hypothetical protein